MINITNSYINFVDCRKTYDDFLKEVNFQHRENDDAINPYLKITTNGKVFVLKSEWENSPSNLDLTAIGLPAKCKYVWRGSERVVYANDTKVYKIQQRLDNETDEQFEQKLLKVQQTVNFIKQKVDIINQNGGVPIEYVMANDTFQNILKQHKMAPNLPFDAKYVEKYDAFYIFYKLNDVGVTFHPSGIIEQNLIDKRTVLGSGAQHLLNSDSNKYGISNTVSSNNFPIFATTGELGKTVDYCEKLNNYLTNVYQWKTDYMTLGNFMFDESKKIVYLTDSVYINNSQ